MQSQVTFASEASGSRRPKTCVGGFVYFLDMGHYPTPPHYPHTPLITPIPPHYSHTLPHYWHGIFKHVGIWLKYLLSNICTTHNSKKVIKKYPNFCCYFPGFTDYYSPDPVFTNFLAPSHYSHTPPYYLHSTPLPPLQHMTSTSPTPPHYPHSTPVPADDASLEERLLLGAIMLSFTLHFVTLYIPFLSLICQVTPLSFAEWVAVIKISISLLLVDEFLSRYFIYCKWYVVQGIQRWLSGKFNCGDSLLGYLWWIDEAYW